MGRHRTINHEERNAKIKELRDKGFTYSKIADELEITQVALTQYRMRDKKPVPKQVKQSAYAKRNWLKDGKNAVAVDATGHMVSIGDQNGWTSIFDPKLKKAIAQAYKLETWIELGGE